MKIAELRELLAKAKSHGNHELKLFENHGYEAFPWRVDAINYIAAAVNALPALLDVAEAAQRMKDKMWTITENLESALARLENS